MLKALFDDGLVIPLPNPWITGLRLRLLRWDLHPGDRRIGLVVQLEWFA